MGGGGGGERVLSHNYSHIIYSQYNPTIYIFVCVCVLVKIVGWGGGGGGGGTKTSRQLLVEAFHLGL